jgi:hypothetical protein
METLDLERVNQFVLQKQHLTEATKTSDIPRIVSDICGLHATGSTPPYLSLYARHPGFKKEMLDDELYQTPTLAKIRCVRKTIYIHTKEMLPIFHSATKRDLERVSKAFMLGQGISEDDYALLVKEVLRALSTEELTAKQLKNRLGTKENISPLLYYMCDQGLLLRARPVAGWRDKNYHYAPIEKYFPDLNLDQMEEGDATLALVRHYLRAFGPLTNEDIFWWTALGKTRVRQALEELGEELTAVSISGLQGPYRLLRSELDALKGAESEASPSINLLPYLDPLLMGYKVRDRYLGDVNHDFIFDRAGNATSAILFDGMVIGVWDFDEKGGPKIKVLFFRKFPGDVLSMVEAKALALGEFIADQPVNVEVCDRMVPFSERTVGSFMSPLRGV